MALAGSGWVKARPDWPQRGLGGIVTALVTALVTGAAVLVTALLMLQPHLVFPVVAAALILSAATMALIALGSPREVGSLRTVYWDIAGAMTLLGFCAALFGEPEQVAALMDRQSAN